MRGTSWRLGLIFVIVAVTTATAHAQLPVPLPVGGGLTALPVADPSQSTDLIVNGGFELNTAGGQPTPVLGLGGPWTPTVTSVSAWRVDGSLAHGGKSSLRMSGVAGAEAYEIFYIPAGVYTFTGYIKTGPGGSGRARLMFDLRNGPANALATPSCVADCGVDVWYISQEIASSTDWTKVSMTFDVTDDHIAASKPSQPGRIKAYAVLDGYWAGPRLIAWYDDVQLLQHPTFPLDVFMRYPNYRGLLFSDADPALRFHVTPQARYATGGYSVRSTLTGPRGVVESTVTPLAGLAEDPYTGKPGADIVLNGSNQVAAAVADYEAVTAQFALVDKNNAEVRPTYPAYRVVKVPASVKPLMNVTVNAQNQIVLGVPRPNDPGQNPLRMPPVPRFTLGVYDSGLASADGPTNWEKVLFDPAGARRMSGLPINLYLNYHLGDAGADTVNSLISTLNNRSIAYLQAGNCFDSTASNSQSPAGFKIDQPGADGSYPYITQAPPGGGIGQAVGGYYTADECTPDMVSGVFTQYQRLVVKDPDSMAFGALLGSDDLSRWRDTVDVIATDPYPLYGAEPVGGYDHGRVAEWTRLAVKAVQGSRPVMTVLQFFKFDASGTNQGRWPTHAEMRNHAYMAIIEGANGLMWWGLGDNALATVCRNTTTWCARRTALMNQLKSVVSEIAALEPVLLKPEPEVLDVAISSVRQNTVEAKPLPTSSIRTMMKRDDTTGKDYLFAYNTTPYYNPDVATPSVTVEVALPTVPQSITVYGESRTILPAATFADTFGPFAAHVYEIASGR